MTIRDTVISMKKIEFHSREGHRSFERRQEEGEESFHSERTQYSRPFSGGFRTARREAPASFEDKLSRFLKDSDERLLDLKRNVESKRGGRGARRSD